MGKKTIDPVEAVCERLRRAMKESGMTQEGIGLRMGFSKASARQAVSRLLNADVKHDPRLSTLILFASAVNKVLKDLLQAALGRTKRGKADLGAPGPKSWAIVASPSGTRTPNALRHNRTASHSTPVASHPNSKMPFPSRHRRGQEVLRWVAFRSVLVKLAFQSRL